MQKPRGAPGRYWETTYDVAVPCTGHCEVTLTRELMCALSTESRLALALQAPPTARGILPPILELPRKTEHADGKKWGITNVR